MIPKVIHYCWFGGKPLPKDVQECIASWKKYCPEYEIRRWSESDFDLDCHPFVRTAYDAKAWAFVSDYARLKIVYDHGGIYLDTDVELLKNLDFLLSNKCYFGIEQQYNLCATGLGFGAEKANPVVKEMLKMYDGILYCEKEKEQIACPILNTAALKKLGYSYGEESVRIDGMLILPPKYMDPLAQGNTKNLLCLDTISIHHYSASWTSKSNRLKRKLFRMIGEENIHRLKKLLKRGS